MSKILKRFMKLDSNAYVFKPAEELVVDEKTPPPPAEGSGEPPPETEEQDPGLEEPRPPQNPVDFAEIQAQAILAATRQEAEKLREKAKQNLEKELEELRKAAREEGYSQGYAEGMADAAREGQKQRDKMAKDQIQAIESFLEAAAYARDQVLDECREEMKLLSLTIAEKVIRISLKTSSDILRRMVEAATEKHKRCEWAHIYIADCDVRGSANTIPELTAALRGISARVRVIPMADDESGTCIIEMPDEILDASVATQLGNIRDVLENAALDEEQH